MNTPQSIYDKILESSDDITDTQILNNRKKVRERFGGDPDEDTRFRVPQKKKLILYRIPKNLKVLLAQGQYKCTCHQQHLTAKRIFEHFGQGEQFEEWIDKLIVKKEKEGEEKEEQKSREEDNKETQTTEVRK